MLTESVCEDLQIEPPSINSNETEPTIVLDNTHLERSQSPDDVILTNNPSAIVNNDKLASDRSPSVSPVPCECLENWKEDEISESETSPKIEKSRSPSPEKEKSRTPSPENFESRWKEQFLSNDKPGRTWLKLFLGRHPQLTYVKPETLSKLRDVSEKQ